MKKVQTKERSKYKMWNPELAEVLGMLFGKAKMNWFSVVKQRDYILNRTHLDQNNGWQYHRIFMQQDFHLKYLSQQIHFGQRTFTMLMCGRNMNIHNGDLSLMKKFQNQRFFCSDFYCGVTQQHRSLKELSVFVWSLEAFMWFCKRINPVKCVALLHTCDKKNSSHMCSSRLEEALMFNCHLVVKKINKEITLHSSKRDPGATAAHFTGLRALLYWGKPFVQRNQTSLRTNTRVFWTVTATGAGRGGYPAFWLSCYIQRRKNTSGLKLKIQFKILFGEKTKAQTVLKVYRFFTIQSCWADTRSV